MFLFAVAMAVFPAVIPHIFAQHLKKVVGLFPQETLPMSPSARIFCREQNICISHFLYE